jgi:hypothetical protein
VRGPWRVLLLAAGAVAAVALFFVFRGESNGENGKAETTTPATTTAAGPTESQPKPEPPPPEVVRIDARGEAPPIRRIKVQQGEMVELVVSSDRADEVHVHGYDIKADVMPTRTARIAFRARLAGRFEIELEERSLLIAVLTVEP